MKSPAKLKEDSTATQPIMAEPHTYPWAILILLKEKTPVKVTISNYTRQFNSFYDLIRNTDMNMVEATNWERV